MASRCAVGSAEHVRRTTVSNGQAAPPLGPNAAPGPPPAPAAGKLTEKKSACVRSWNSR